MVLLNLDVVTFVRLSCYGLKYVVITFCISNTLRPCTFSGSAHFVFFFFLVFIVAVLGEPSIKTFVYAQINK